MMSSTQTPKASADQVICPITCQVFCDPVLAKDGHSYEREAITKWILDNGTSPLTGEPLEITDLVANTDLQSYATAFRNLVLAVKKHNGKIPLLPNIQDCKPDQTNAVHKRQCSTGTFFVIMIFFASIAILTTGIVLIVKSHQKGIGITISNRDEDFFGLFYSNNLIEHELLISLL